jgi:hypothetical protein
MWFCGSAASSQNLHLLRYPIVYIVLRFRRVMLYIEVRKTRVSCTVSPLFFFFLWYLCHTHHLLMSVVATFLTCNIHSGHGILSKTTRESNIYTRALGNELSPCGRYCVLLLVRTPGDGGCRNECCMRGPRGACVSAVLQHRPFPIQVTLERSNTCSIKLIEVAVA